MFRVSGATRPCPDLQATEIQLLPDLVKNRVELYIRRRHDLVADGLSELLFSQTGESITAYTASNSGEDPGNIDMISQKHGILEFHWIA